VGLEGYGLRVVERVPLVIRPTAANRAYLDTKREKLGHLILPAPRSRRRAAKGNGSALAPQAKAKPD
jgi:hypothetical protein